jgi:hypothetical protein
MVFIVRPVPLAGTPKHKKLKPGRKSRLELMCHCRSVWHRECLLKRFSPAVNGYRRSFCEDSLTSELLFGSYGDRLLLTLKYWIVSSLGKCL